jgi:phosphonate transport system substrate-binding protein
MVTIRSMVFILAMVVLSFSDAGAQDVRRTYVISVLPQKPPVVMHQRWMPFVELLQHETGLTFRLKLYEKMEEFEADLKKGVPDFIFSTPPQTVLAHHAQGYIPLVRSSHKLSGILFVRRDSTITSIRDLEGKEIAFVGAKNLCSIIVRHVLAKQAVPLNFKPIPSGSTSNVYMNVILGKADAGATLDLDIQEESPEIQSQLRVIVTTDPLAPHPLSAHPRVYASHRQLVRDAIINMAKKRDEAPRLLPVRLASPVAADYNLDYKGLEEIDIEGLSNQF